MDKVWREGSTLLSRVGWDVRQAFGLNQHPLQLGAYDFLRRLFGVRLTDIQTKGCVPVHVMTRQSDLRGWWGKPILQVNKKPLLTIPSNEKNVFGSPRGFFFQWPHTRRGLIRGWFRGWGRNFQGLLPEIRNCLYFITFLTAVEKITRFKRFKWILSKGENLSNEHKPFPPKSGQSQGSTIFLISA